MQVLAFFTNSGVPATGLSPTVRIRDISDNSLLVTDAAASEIGDGWYKYDFTTYNSTEEYAIRFDGGVTLENNDRYTSGTNDSFVDDITDGVWNAPVENHLIEGTMGHGMYHDAFNEHVYIDVVNGQSGTTFPLGTRESPVDNILDALLIASIHSFQYLHVMGLLTISGGENISGYTVIADRSLNNEVIVIDSTTSETYFENLTVSGIMNGSVRYTTSVLGAIDNFDGGAKNCLLTDDINITGNGANYFTDCDTYVTDSNLFKKLTVNGGLLNIIRCRGNYEIAGKTSTNTTSIDLVAGIIKVDNDCIDGEIFIAGIAEVIDDSGAGCEVDIRSMSHSAISENVWDEVLNASTHNLPGTAGRRMRTLTSMVIRNENAQGPGTDNNQIQFDVGASTLDGAYDPAVVSIIAGTGSGQTRLILQYEGSTRIATVDRKWRINPDDTSEFIIIADAGREHVNEGLARGGTINTITLNTSASPNNNAYKGQVIFIRSGYAEDQARRIISYDGITKIATVGSAWAIIPNTTSAYVTLPTGTITPEMISRAVLDAELADHKTPGTYGNELATKADLVASTNTDSTSAISGVVVYGTQDVGTYNSTFIRDGSYWVIEEDAVTGITVEMTFNIPNENRAGILRLFGRYEGTPSATHYIDLWAYNYKESAWEQLKEEFIPGGITIDAEYEEEYFERNIDRNNNNEVKFRLIHNVTTYVATHHMYLDFVEVTSVDVILAADIADAVLNEQVTDHLTVGSLGYVINEINLDLKRALGLMHENIYIDNPIYDEGNNLVSARVRIYSDGSSVGTDNNIIGAYNIASNTDNNPGKFNTWSQVKI